MHAVRQVWPLARFRSVRSNDPVATHAAASTLMNRHRMRVDGSEAAFDADIRHTNVGGVGLLSFAYGAAVEIAPAPLESFLAIHLPLAGRLDVATESAHDSVATVRPGAGVIISPHDRVRMRWSPDLRLLVVRLDAARILAKLRAMSGLRAPRRLSFAPIVDRGGGDRALSAAIGTVIATADSFAGDGVPEPLAAELEELLVSLLLLEHDHSQADAVATSPEASASAAAVVRAATDAVRENGAANATVETLAAAAHVSERTLYEAFRRELGCSPMSWVRSRRLEAARTALLAACTADGATVAAIARANGIAHVGRFAAAYRERYGEPPSATLGR
ncbi:MAG: AraC family transcriptional regulator [Pseudoclavibacter sp.]